LGFGPKSLWDFLLRHGFGMKIKFDSNQDFQLDAIRLVVEVFDGQAV